MRRSVALWAVLFAAYGATLGVPALGSADYAGDEPHYLLTAESLVSDGDVDLRDEYATRAYADFYPSTLRPRGTLVRGHRNEPHGVGLPLLIAPAYAVAGATGAALLLAAIAALAFALAAALARRIVPEPWATRAALLVGLSPPALAYATAVGPPLAAGAALCGAIALALRVREDPRRRHGLAAAALLALLPWLGARYAVPAAPVLIALVHWTMRHGRRVLGLLEVELVAGSLVAFAIVDDVLFGGLTPAAAQSPAETVTVDFPGGYVARLPRLVGLWLDRDAGLLRWAPVLGLSFLGAYLLWRSRREQVARIAPERRDAEVAAGLALLVCVAQIAAAVLLAPSLSGSWFPGRELVAALPPAAALAAWGLRWAPRTAAVLAALTVVASGWLLAALALGEADGWAGPGTEAPIGPLVRLLPRFGVGSAWADAVTAAVAAGAAALCWREWRQWRALHPRSA